MTPERKRKIAAAVQAYQDGLSVGKIYAAYKVHSTILYRELDRLGIPRRTQAEQRALWLANQQRKNLEGTFNGATSPLKKPRTVDTVSDVPCGWDGTPVIVTIAPGETWCRTCYETTTGNYCARCGTGNAETVQAADVLRRDEYRVMT